MTFGEHRLCAAVNTGSNTVIYQRLYRLRRTLELATDSLLLYQKGSLSAGTLTRFHDRLDTGVRD